MIVNPSDWDNEGTDDPDFWEEGNGGEPCPWCGSEDCGHMDDDGNVVCGVTDKVIPS